MKIRAKHAVTTRQLRHGTTSLNRSLVMGAAVATALAVPLTSTLASADSVDPALLKAPTAYVANLFDNTVTAFNATTGHVIKTIKNVNGGPSAIALTPNNATAYVVDQGGAIATPIDLATKTAKTPITVGTQPYDMAITPDGATGFVTDDVSNQVTPITLATGIPGPPITIGPGPVTNGKGPNGIVVTPDGTTAYVVISGTNTVTPINVATHALGT